jgi:hypothetical protein
MPRRNFLTSIFGVLLWPKRRDRSKVFNLNSADEQRLIDVCVNRFNYLSSRNFWKS